MILPFFKYHGTGNDFIMVDNREGKFSDLTRHQVEQLCHRRFGIGADGLILLSPSETSAFYMDYFNSDGRRSSMCGNGGRCIAVFAKDLGIITDKAEFMAADGPHEAWLTDQGVKLRMTLPHGYRKMERENDHWIHTGSPHYVRFLDSGVSDMDVKKEGSAVRYSDEWKQEGTNVNFAEPAGDNRLQVRTYERGVEDETWSCGTGVTAVAEIWTRLHPGIGQPVEILTPGGKLWVHCRPGEAPWLEGAALFVFEGRVDIS